MTDPAGTVLVAAVEGTSLSAAELSFFRREQPSGVTLFRRNVPPNHREVRALVAELQATRSSSAPPLVIAIDQEGGRVARLTAPFPNPGPAMQLAAGRVDEDAIRVVTDAGSACGRELASLGINVNFAPVLDVLTEPTNTAIGDRAFGTDQETVIARASAWLSGLQATGVFGCLKHFPGQGDAKVDTHEGTAVIDLPREVLDRRELVPFRALAGRAPMIMVAHCIYPQLSPLEATRSPQIIGQLLRGELRYEGVVVSDDLNMGALPQDGKEWQSALVQVVAAGCDMLLVCRHLERCQSGVEALRREAARSRAFAERLEAAATRVLKMRGRLLPVMPA